MRYIMLASEPITEDKDYLAYVLDMYVYQLGHITITREEWETQGGE